MPRTKRDASLDTRAKRKRLRAKTSPYWTWIAEGCSIGYRKNQRGGVWVARFYNADVTPSFQQTKLGQTDDENDADGVAIFNFSQALDLARRWYRDQTAQARGVRRIAAYTVVHAMRDYMEEFKRRGKRTAIETKRTIDFHINPRLGEVLVEKLTRDNVRKWLNAIVESPARRRSKKNAEPRYKPAPTTDEEKRRRKDTANRVLTVLKAGLNFALREGHVECSGTAWREIKPFHAVGAIRQRFLTSDEQQKFTSACEGDFKLLVLGALHSGARYGELARLKVQDFNGHSLYVPALISKTAKSRTINLDRDAKKFFAAMVAKRSGGEYIFLRNGGFWGKSEQFRPMREACKTAKLTDFPFYTLRHTAASNWLRAGVPMKYIAEQMGNSLAICERHYAHIAPDHRAEVFANLPSLGLQFGPTESSSLQ